MWTKTDQGLILSSYFWGYLITHLPGGWLAEVWGSKNLLALSIAMQALPAFFIPVSAHASPYLVLVLRIIQGLAAVSSRFFQEFNQRLLNCLAAIPLA